MAETQMVRPDFRGGVVRLLGLLRNVRKVVSTLEFSQSLPTYQQTSPRDIALLAKRDQQMMEIRALAQSLKEEDNRTEEELGSLDCTIEATKGEINL